VLRQVRYPSPPADRKLTRAPVGIGRPFLYAFSSYGHEGVDHALNILRDEFTMNMRLIGARNLKEIVPEMVDASNIGCHIVAVPGDELYNSNCKPGFSWFRCLVRNPTHFSPQMSTCNTRG